MSTYQETLQYGEDPYGTRGGEHGERKSLAPVCSPLFFYLTGFRRNSATSALAPAEVRRRLKEILDAIHRECEEHDRLSKVLPKVWYALVVTADQAILSSDWSEKVTWSLDLLETTIFSTSEGGHRFYEMVEETLSRPGDEAAEIAEVMFTCMALGFQGELLGDRKRYERKRMDLYEKARLPGALGETLAPQAYGRNAAKTLVRLPKVGLSRVILVTLATLLFFVLVGYFYTGHLSSKTRGEVQGLIQKIEAEASAR